MRHATARAVLIGAVLMLPACADDPAPEPPAPSVPASTRAVDPATASVCRDVREVNRGYTDRFTTQLRAASTALDAEDRRSAETTTRAIRTTFAQWSAALRSRAGELDDPDLHILLTQYAGAVDATIARVRTADDLDRLYTFTEKELDVMAGRLADTCP